ncbi:MAG TPA: choline-sulfatase [Solirubrobacteraceae bacterium]|nr:choline-sulfatase [Solirubrobacteraceae bacterium]
MISGQPPSFLVLMADQLAASWLPAYGHPLVHAPHLSALAGSGTVFENAYCPFPLCAPSRSAMLTGRLASDIGVYDNAAELAATVPTLAHALRANGYHTAVAGKMHFVGPDQLHGFEHRLTADIYPADVDWTPDWSRSLDRPLPWYHTMESVLDPGVSAAAMQTDYDQEVAFQAVRKLYDLARHRPDQPFLLFVSFTNPHDPWEIPERHWARYRRSEIADPSVPSIPLQRADPHSRRLRAMCRVDEAQLSADQIRRARHGYFAAVSYLDERVGEVLDALERSGMSERTTVLFCADHGEMLGERGLWYKMSFHEPSARVPLIIRAPGGRPGRIAQPVSLLDVTPTLMELAGLAPEQIAHGPVAASDPGDVRGDLRVAVSLAAAVASGGPAPARPVISEYHAEGVTAPSAMVRDGRFKLIRSLEDPDLLYDLEADPLELHDLSGSVEHASTVARLGDELEARLDLAAVGPRVLASQRGRHLVSAALARGIRPQWDFEPASDSSTRYVRNRDDLYELQRRSRLDVGEPDAV